MTGFLTSIQTVNVETPSIPPSTGFEPMSQIRSPVLNSCTHFNHKVKYNFTAVVLYFVAVYFMPGSQTSLCLTVFKETKIKILSLTCSEIICLKSVKISEGVKALIYVVLMVIFQIYY